jgi:hypothetical protein
MMEISGIHSQVTNANAFRLVVRNTISVTQVYPNRTVESGEMADTRHAVQLNLNLKSRLFLNCQFVIALIKKRQRMNQMHMLILTEFNRQQDERRSDGAESTETIGLHKIFTPRGTGLHTKKREHDLFWRDSS